MTSDERQLIEKTLEIAEKGWEQGNYFKLEHVVKKLRKVLNDE